MRLSSGTGSSKQGSALLLPPQVLDRPKHNLVLTCSALDIH